MQSSPLRRLVATLLPCQPVLWMDPVALAQSAYLAPPPGTAPSSQAPVARARDVSTLFVLGPPALPMRKSCPPRLPMVVFFAILGSGAAVGSEAWRAARRCARGAARCPALQ
jgi:hypothetical protein